LPGVSEEERGRVAKHAPWRHSPPTGSQSAFPVHGSPHSPRAGWQRCPAAQSPSPRHEKVASRGGGHASAPANTAAATQVLQNLARVTPPPLQRLECATDRARWPTRPAVPRVLVELKAGRSPPRREEGAQGLRMPKVRAPRQEDACPDPRRAGLWTAAGSAFPCLPRRAMVMPPLTTGGGGPRAPDTACPWEGAVTPGMFQADIDRRRQGGPM
jgi:hypothetical protein